MAAHQNIAVVALANKLARIAWAVLRRCHRQAPAADSCRLFGAGRAKRWLREVESEMA